MQHESLNMKRVVFFYIDNTFFDCARIAEYLTSLRPSAPLFALIKFRSGAHTLRVETDRWLIPKPPRDQRVCRHCTVQAIEDEQHLLFDCRFYSIIRAQHFSLFGSNYQQRDIRLFFEQNGHQLGFVAPHIHLCFRARMSDESTPETLGIKRNESMHFCPCATRMANYNVVCSATLLHVALLGRQQVWLFRHR